MLLTFSRVLLTLVAPSVAHGPTFGVVSVAPAPDDANVVWAIVEGWGLVRTDDAGATWIWRCEEALSPDVAVPEPMLAIVARASQVGTPRAWVGTRGGLLAVDGACGGGSIAGLPEGAYVASLATLGEGVLALATGPVAGGVYRCEDAGCVATGLVRDGLFPKSIARDGDRWWVTTVDAETLAARLWRSDDALAWREVTTGGGAMWPDGDRDVRLLDVDGDRLLAWARTRGDADVPTLLRSDDGGGRWRSVLEHGTWQDAAPGFARTVNDDGVTLWLGSARGARTWSSYDDGRTWSERSLEMPALRCAGVSADDTVWGCADHLADGFDLSIFRGDAWRPAACVSEVATAPCDDGACDAFEGLYDEAARSGGSSCAVDDAAADTLEASNSPCGCASAGAGASLAMVGAATLLLAARRR